MILADTSIWADHINQMDALLYDLLNEEEIVVHPYVIGELLLGNPKDYQFWRERLNALPQLLPVLHSNVMRLVENYQLYGTGIGYVDVHLLASAKATRDCLLWTRDNRLAKTAEKLDVGAGYA